LHYNIPLNEVENLDVDDYSLKIFTIFNNAVLHSMDANKFQFQTDDEFHDEFVELISEAKKQGFDL